MRTRSNWSHLLVGVAVSVAAALAACSGEDGTDDGGSDPATGGAAGETGGAATETGGASTETGGASTETGGLTATGGTATETGGVSTETGGLPATGGVEATGGLTATGGIDATGGDPATGGAEVTGGLPATGGVEATGGLPATGGVEATGGLRATGGASADFWQDDYNPQGLPSPSSGEHRAGDDCMGCHDSMGSRTWAFGGTVYESDGSTGAPNVQIGIWDGVNFWSTYSGNNGNFWVPANGPSIDWASAEVRMRNENGEVAMESEAAAGCNGCHSDGLALIAP